MYIGKNKMIRRKRLRKEIKTAKLDDTFLRVVKEGIQKNGKLLERLAKK